MLPVPTNEMVATLGGRATGGSSGQADRGTVRYNNSTAPNEETA